jgi:hypothetical protein
MQSLAEIEEEEEDEYENRLVSFSKIKTTE